MAEHGRHMVGQRVRATRGRRGWSREALAQAAGISHGAVVQVESGRRADSRITTIAALADALEVPIDYLLGRHGTRPELLDHQVLRYASDEQFLEATVPLIDNAVSKHEPTLAVTTAYNARLLRGSLGGHPAGLTLASAARWYRSPADTLDAYRRFVVEKLDNGHHWVWIIGEPVWHGRSRHEVHAWTSYEALLNIVFAPFPVSVVCPYDERRLSAPILASTTVTHPRIRIAGRGEHNDAFAGSEQAILR
jgi:transcriptional regulator with XRE-family HTH domain